MSASCGICVAPIADVTRREPLGRNNGLVAVCDSCANDAVQVANVTASRGIVRKEPANPRALRIREHRDRMVRVDDAVLGSARGVGGVMSDICRTRGHVFVLGLRACTVCGEANPAANPAARMPLRRRTPPNGTPMNDTDQLAHARLVKRLQQNTADIQALQAQVAQLGDVLAKAEALKRERDDLAAKLASMTTAHDVLYKRVQEDIASHHDGIARAQRLERTLVESTAIRDELHRELRETRTELTTLRAALVEALDQWELHYRDFFTTMDCERAARGDDADINRIAELRRIAEGA